MNTLPPTLPTTEQTALSAEFAQKNTPQALASSRVLNAISKEEPPPAEETPPLPEHLRDRWRQKFGRVNQVGVASPSLWSGLRELFSSKWVVGAGLAFGCLAVGLSMLGDPAGISTSGKPTLRGHGTPTVADSGAALLVVTADAGAEFAKVWTGRAVQVFADNVAAETAAKASPKAIIANGLAASVSIWVDGKMTTTTPVEKILADPNADLASALNEALLTLEKP